jgi:hypothetical protein
MAHKIYVTEHIREEKNPGSETDFIASTSMKARFKELTVDFEAGFQLEKDQALRIAIGSRATDEAINRIYKEYDRFTKD